LFRSAKRRLAAIASATFVAVGLSAAAGAAAQAAAQQSGPSWPGDLLSMNNADFENGVGNWQVSSNVSTLTTGTTAFLHNHSLKIVAAKAGTSVIQMSGSGVQIKVDSGDQYRVGAYLKMNATSGHTTEFELGCYQSGGKISWSAGSPVGNNSTGAWQWVQDVITVPSGCTAVQDSPRVDFTGMHAGDVAYMDEAWFAPYRAALMIGAYEPNPAAWNQANTSIGPLQSDKIFFGGGSPALPGNWKSKTNKCYELEQSHKNLATWPTCVINLADFENKTQITDFLTDLPAAQTVIMVYHGEPEGKTFQRCPAKAIPVGDAANFVCYFGLESGYVRSAAVKLGLTENVFTADDAASHEYGNHGAGMYPERCAWIAPSSEADFYFVDHYERGWANGTNLSVQNGQANVAQQWNNWLGCVDNSTKPIGLAEYGLCAGTSSCNKGTPPAACLNEASSAKVTATMTADNSYLANNPSGDSPTLLWEYWYDKCWTFTNAAHGITKWQSIENQNGGVVGG
jgi:hypothetical protein